MLGDNAYGEGTDHQHQFAIFEDMYEALLRSSVLYPTIGNHDWQSGSQVPYFDIFTLPTKAEAGGVPSNTERYYSFDWGNAHFICLHTDDPPPEMLDWLKQDLAATKALWRIAFFHKPPHTKGSHDSDKEGDLDFVRNIINPELEAAGVDLVLAGHSHNYERSVLVSGFYGESFKWDPEFAVDPGDGRDGSDGAYQKPETPGPGQGTVYVVNGNSGARGEWGDYPLDHPMMVELTNPTSNATKRGLMSPGSMVLDLNGKRLDAKYIDEDGKVLDEFTILKGDGATATGGSGGGAGAPGSGGARASPSVEQRRPGLRLSPEKPGQKC